MTSRRQAWLDRLITWSPVLLLGALAALTYWLNAQVQVSGPSFDGSGRHDADIFVDNFKAFNLDQDGRIRQALVAKRAQHYPDDDTTTLDAPEIAFTDPDKPRLDVTADHAKITGDREHAYFEGHVKAVREASTDAEGKIQCAVVPGAYTVNLKGEAFQAHSLMDDDHDGGVKDYAFVVGGGAAASGCPCRMGRTARQVIGYRRSPNRPKALKVKGTSFPRPRP